MNKNEYKEAVNKIVVSDELREKIIHNSSEKKTHKYNKNNIYKSFRKVSGIAACFAFCILSYYMIKNYYHFSADIPMDTTPPPIQTPNNSNSSNTKGSNIASVNPDIDNVQNNTNTSDEQHLPNNTDHTETAINSSVQDITNNSVGTDNSSINTNTSDEQHLPNNIDHTETAVNSSAQDITNNSVGTDNSSISSASQEAQSNSFDKEDIEQDNFSPVPSISSSPDNNMPIKNIDNVRNNTNTSDEQHLPNNTSHTATTINSSAQDITNNSVGTDNSSISSTSQEAQSNSFDKEDIEQDNFSPALGTASSPDNNTPIENNVGNKNMNAECAVYSVENMSTITEIERELGYDIKIPHYVPDDYKTDSLSALFGKFAEIIYKNETNMLCYRTEKCSEDISGDYNNYTDIETVIINNNAVTIKGNNNLYYNAIWFAEDEAFSVYSDNGIEKDTMIDIVKSVN